MPSELKRSLSDVTEASIDESSKKSGLLLDGYQVEALVKKCLIARLLILVSPFSSHWPDIIQNFTLQQIQAAFNPTIHWASEYVKYDPDLGDVVLIDALLEEPDSSKNLDQILQNTLCDVYKQELQKLADRSTAQILALGNAESDTELLLSDGDSVMDEVLLSGSVMYASVPSDSSDVPVTVNKHEHDPADMFSSDLLSPDLFSQLYVGCVFSGIDNEDIPGGIDVSQPSNAQPFNTHRPSS